MIVFGYFVSPLNAEFLDASINVSCNFKVKQQKILTKYMKRTTEDILTRKGYLKIH